MGPMGQETNGGQPDEGWLEAAGSVVEVLAVGLGGTEVRHGLTDADIRTVCQGFQAYFWAAFAASCPNLQRTQGTQGFLDVLIPDAHGEVAPRRLQVINAVAAADLPGREPVLVCAQRDFNLEDGIAWPVLLFPARAFLRGTQVHEDAPGVLDDLAARMSATLACLFQDLRAFVETLRAEGASVTNARLLRTSDTHLRWSEEGRFESFGIAKFLVAIYAVAQAYTQWSPLGRGSLSLDAASQEGDSADYLTTEGPHAAVTPGFASVLRRVPRPRGAALDVVSSFLHVCLSEGHQGPNTFLVSQLFYQRKWRDRPTQCCRACFWRELGELCAIPFATWEAWTVQQWLKGVNISRTLEEAPGKPPPLLTSDGIAAISRMGWTNIAAVWGAEDLEAPIPSTLEAALTAGFPEDVKRVVASPNTYNPYTGELHKAAMITEQEWRAMNNFTLRGVAKAVGLAGQSQWEHLKAHIRKYFPADLEATGASAVTLVLTLLDLRRRMGVRRSIALRVCADFMPTISGTLGKRGWVG
ncbi:hypothetical protein N9L68_06385 [bacterium]|nr:hypothetical protein [bacterium]